MSFLSYLNPRAQSTLNFPQFSLVDLTVLTSYYLFTLLLFLSSFGLLGRAFVVAGLAAGFLFFGCLFWKRIEWKKHYLYFFIIIPFILAGVLLLKGYFAGMGMAGFLPWVREMVLQGKMVYSFDAVSVGVTSKAPLMPLFYAGAFGLFGFSHWVIAILPLFFSAATVFLVYLWLSEKGLSKNYLIFGILLLLANPLFLEVGMHPLQEPFILFFFTAFFYYLEKLQHFGEHSAPVHSVLPTRLFAPRQARGSGSPHPNPSVHRHTMLSRMYFLLLFLSAVLAAVSKETGLILFLPLGWLFIKNLKNRQLSGRFLLYSSLAVLPLLLWLLRNYIFFDNPISPYLNGVFRGRYYDLILAVNRAIGPLTAAWSGGISQSVSGIFSSLISSFFPLILLSFYGFFKKRKIQHIFLFLILFSMVLFVERDISGGFIRYLMPFLAVFIVYAVAGLQEAKSRIFLSFIFFISLLGLFSSELPLSKSQFIIPFEGMLNGLRIISQFIFDYRLAAALALSLFFFIFLSREKHRPHYLILLTGCVYLVGAEVFHLGLWLNIWLPILSVVFIALIWRMAIKLKEGIFLGFTASYVVILLIFNGWGLSLAYFLAHDGFVFPNTAEAYEFRPEISAEIEKIEGENKDFYILADNPSYFAWYRNFKMATLWSHSFYTLTNLEYKDGLDPQEVRDLFKASSIKYVVESGRYGSNSDIFYDKIKTRPDLFEPIFQKGKIYAWRIYE